MGCKFHDKGIFNVNHLSQIRSSIISSLWVDIYQCQGSLWKDGEKPDLIIDAIAIQVIRMRD